LSGRSPRIDAALARRRFSRAARSYAQAVRLESEVAARMLERLDLVKLSPRRVLDAGSGLARETPAISRRYGAELIALDSALGMLRAAKRGWLRKAPLRVCADLARLPLAAESVELIWCNMALHWVNDPLAVFREFERVLAPGGLAMFSTLGPDTLKELRGAAGEARVHAFADMHDLGDMLVAAGLSAPVMDMELVRIDYASGARLLDDLRRSGQTNARADRPRGLAGRGFLAPFREAPMRATYEVVYGHAWKAQTAKTIRVFKRIP
jgi:malonyl-CoA O-methyltransferase